MSTAPVNPSEDDVQRLLKQMKMGAFQFRSFSRPDEADDQIESEPEAAAHPPAAATPAPAPAPAPAEPARPPVPLRVAPLAPPVIAAATVPAAPSPAKPVTTVPVDEAFGRLIREPGLRARRKPSIQLKLAPRPAIVDVAPTSTRELLLVDVLNRLYRLGSARISLVRQRGDA